MTQKETVTITAETVSKDTDGLFPKYTARDAYSFWIFSGEYDILITSKEYEKARKTPYDIEKINYNHIGAQSIPHATWNILPRIIALIIITTIYLIDLRKYTYLFKSKDKTDMWSEPENPLTRKE